LRQLIQEFELLGGIFLIVILQRGFYASIQIELQFVLSLDLIQLPQLLSKVSISIIHRRKHGG